MLTIPKVLLFGCDSNEKDSLEEILAPHAELTWVGSQQDLVRQLEDADYDVLFCSGSLSLSVWSDVLEEVHQLVPSLPVILISEVAGDNEELLADGAFEFLTALCCGPKVVPAGASNEVNTPARQWQERERAKASEWRKAESWASGLGIETELLRDGLIYEQKKSLPRL